MGPQLLVGVKHPGLVSSQPLGPKTLEGPKPFVGSLFTLVSKL